VRVPVQHEGGAAVSVSPHDRASAIFTTVARAVCWAPEPPRSASKVGRFEPHAVREAQ
jgi:hypothetical protein